LDETAQVRAKIGLVRITGKQAQFMFRLATFSTTPLFIEGIDSQGQAVRIQGKPRGSIE